MEKVLMGDDPTDLDACYDALGDAYVEINGVHIPAARYIYTETRGPIREGAALTHLCGNRLCLNTQHMRIVDPKENAEKS